MENNESFASPKEETEHTSKVIKSAIYQKIYDIIKQIPIKSVDGDAMDAGSASSLIEQLFCKETPASKEKPDFEKMAHSKLLEIEGGNITLWDVPDNECSRDYWKETYTSGMERIWIDHVEPRDKQIAALQEKIRQLKNKQ